jgi:hypothetical protein
MEDLRANEINVIECRYEFHEHICHNTFVNWSNDPLVDATVAIVSQYQKQLPETTLSGVPTTSVSGLAVPACV